MNRFVLMMTTWAAVNAMAQTVVQEPDRVVVKKRTVIELNEVSLEGEIQRPESSYVAAPLRPGFKNLIRVRGSFQPELQKSVDHL